MLEEMRLGLFEGAGDDGVRLARFRLYLWCSRLTRTMCFAFYLFLDV